MLNSPGLCAQIACVWEATARKPGNVHRYCDFEDSTYLDYLLSAAALAPVLDRAADRRIGETILDAVRATRRVTRSNTNLGIVLLLTPLASVPLSHVRSLFLPLVPDVEPPATSRRILHTSVLQPCVVHRAD